jgi:porin
MSATRSIRVTDLRWFATVLVVAVLFGNPALFAEEASQEEQETAAEESGEQNSNKVPQFGGPTSVGGQINEDQGDREMRLSWRENLAEKGFSFSLNYAALYQNASASPGEDDAAGGIFQLPISWTVSSNDKGNSGTIVFSVESRNRLGTEIPPQDLGLATGAVSITGTAFSNPGWFVSNLHWMQRTRGGKLNFALGRVALTDFLDVYGMFNPQTAFANLAFLTNPTIAAPAEGLGGILGAMLNENWYLTTGFSDANAISTTSGFDTFTSGELFKQIEIGHTTSQDRAYLDNTHVTLWHVDERVEAGVSRGSGGTFSFARFLDERWMPFLRVGFSDGGGGALQEAAAAAGFGWYRPDRDLLGVAVAWGQPSEDTFLPGLGDQWTAEAFYRWQLTQMFAVTGDVQLIANPSLNPDESQIVIFGLRARLSL